MPKAEILAGGPEETAQDTVQGAGQTDEIETQGDENGVQLSEGEEQQEGAETAEGGTAAGEQTATDGAEETVTIGDDKPEETEAAPVWVRELRQNYRAAQKRIRELEAQGSKTPENVLPPKPRLSQFDYDEEKFEAATTEWHEKKRKIDELEAQSALQAAEQAKAWQAKLDSYGAAKAALKFKDYEDAEGAVQDGLTQNQQAIIVSGAKNPALVVYALGKNPGKLTELKAITNPVEFAFAVANLENQLKVTKKAPPPERIPKGGNAPISGTIGSNLDRLRADAMKNGDISEVLRLRREQRAKERARG